MASKTIGPFKHWGLRLALPILVSFGIGAQAQADIIFSEDFSSGLGAFSDSGRVYTGSYGVRMRGGTSDGVITSSSIDTSGYENLVLTFERSTSGLDFGEAGIASVSVNGGSYSVLESQRTASGAV